LEGKKGLSNWDVFTHKQGEAMKFVLLHNFNLEIVLPIFFYLVINFVFSYVLFFKAQFRMEATAILLLTTTIVTWYVFCK
jgi:hypothetical protein